MIEPDAFGFMVLIGGLMYLALRVSNPMSWQCPDCGGSTNAHFPSCKRVKK